MFPPEAAVLFPRSFVLGIITASPLLFYFPKAYKHMLLPVTDFYTSARYKWGGSEEG